MKKKKKPFILKQLLPYAGKKKALFAESLILSALSSVLGLLPFVFIWLIAKKLFVADVSLASGDIHFYAWMTLACALASMVIYFFALMASHLAAFRVEVGMRKFAMRKIINMPLGFFDKNQSGKMRKIIDDNASQTHTFLAHQMPDLASTIIAPIVILILMFVVDWRMGLISLIPIALGFFSMSFMMSKEGETLRTEYMNSLEEMSSEAVEYVRGIPVVKTFGQSVYAFRRFVDSITRYREMVMTYTVLWQKPMAFYMIIMQSTAFFLVPFTILLIAKGENITAALVDFLFYLVIAPNFTLLFMRSMYFQNHASIAEETINRFDAILDYPEMTFKKDGPKPHHFDLAFKSVSFTYPGAKTKALDNVSFTVKAGETVALVGPSGGGKTTIARLAARFWDVQSGEILIDGHNIKDLSREDLMNSISFVFQNTKLFKKTIRENILYGKADATEEELQRAINLSQSRDIIDQLPKGLETHIGKKGTYLSGGEQQRIALARAILKSAPIALLDEATAFADPENEHVIQKVLRELSKNTTTLMIAHRLTSVQDADKVLVIEDGKIAQQGTHQELLAQSGKYKKMWEEYQRSVEWTV